MNTKLSIGSESPLPIAASSHFSANEPADRATDLPVNPEDFQDRMRATDAWFKVEYGKGPRPAAGQYIIPPFSLSSTALMVRAPGLMVHNAATELAHNKKQRVARGEPMGAILQPPYLRFSPQQTQPIDYYLKEFNHE